jgi:hypothetical protein
MIIKMNEVELPLPRMLMNFRNVDIHTTGGRPIEGRGFS